MRHLGQLEIIPPAGVTCSLLNVDPGDTLFVDDRPENVAGAEQAGLLAHRYISPDALAERLRSFGLF